MTTINDTEAINETINYLTLQKQENVLHNIILYEPINAKILDKLINSKLLKQTFNNKQMRVIYDNEKQQLMAYSELLKKGYARVKYTRTKGSPFGRCNPIKGLGLYNIRREIRHTLAIDGLVDLDIDNCHPAVLLQILTKSGMNSPKLSAYVEHRDDYLRQVKEHYGVDRDTAKVLFIRLLYSGGIANWRKDFNIAEDIKDMPFVKEFVEEFNRNANTIKMNNPDIVKLVVKQKKEKKETSYNLNGSVCSYFLQEYECRILECMFKYCKENNYIQKDIAVLCADGLMIEAKNYTPDLLDEFHDLILEKFGFDLAFSNKQMDKGYNSTLDENLNDDYLKSLEEKTKTSKGNFDELALEFEKTHCKILDGGLYVERVEDDNIIRSKQGLCNAFEHMSYIKAEDENSLKSSNFIGKWTHNNDNIRKYNRMDTYPNADLCPKSIYNLWLPFEFEKHTEPYTSKPDALAKFRQHIKIMCNHEDAVAKYIEGWIACLIQYPEVKTITPVFVSNQGSGKNSLIYPLKAILGRKKVIELINPERDVWGSFNGLMKDLFLGVLDEMSKSTSTKASGFIKGLQTAPRIVINEKGVGQYEINSNHHFIIFSNDIEGGAIQTSNDDRRNLIIKSSDELIGNKKYFDELYNDFKDIEVLRTIYDYFKNLPDMEKFNSQTVPKTIYQRNLAQLTRCPIEQWLYNFVRQHQDEKIVLFANQQLYDSFNSWKANSGCDEYKLTLNQFCVRLANKRIAGLETKHTNHGNCKELNIQTLKNYFDTLGCNI